jgi:hypothetical protein
MYVTILHNITIYYKLVYNFMPKTIKLNRKQVLGLAETLSKEVLNESVNPDMRDFRSQVPVEIEYPREYNGRRIWGFNVGYNITLRFDLSVLLREWGIDSIGIGNVRGPRDIEAELELEPVTDDDEDYYYDHTLQINWSEYEIDSDSNNTDLHLGIEKVTLYLDEQLFVSKIGLHPITDLPL